MAGLCNFPTVCMDMDMQTSDSPGPRNRPTIVRVMAIIVAFGGVASYAERDGSLEHRAVRGE